MAEVIEEVLDWNSEPTPIDYARCRAIVGAAQQCKNRKSHEIQEKGICGIHYMALQRGKRLRFQKEKAK
jgi:hypothetical protein